VGIKGIPLYNSWPECRTIIPNIFAQINSSHLTEAEIELWVDNEVNIGWLDWKQLAHVLNQPHFTSLKKLRIVVVYPPPLDHEACCLKIVGEMNVLDKRDVLEFKLLPRGW
jgi:hypothetical protein